MMEFIFGLLVVLHSSAVALGLGSSTIAIAGFLTALGDGKMDVSERRIMGVVYFSLRVAMVTILLFTLLIMWMKPGFFGSFTTPQLVLTAVLYLNAVLMTKHWISMKIGPAIQAGTWYTFGFLITMYIFDLLELTPAVAYGFLLGDIVVAILIVNGCLKYLAWRREREEMA